MGLIATTIILALLTFILVMIGLFGLVRLIEKKGWL